MDAADDFRAWRQVNAITDSGYALVVAKRNFSDRYTLRQIAVVANNRLAIDDDAAKMTDVKSISDLRSDGD